VGLEGKRNIRATKTIFNLVISRNLVANGPNQPRRLN
jgi:hypothetical protein